MSILAYCFIAIAVILAGFLIFSLCTNLIFWYETLNTPKCAVPLPKPGFAVCVSKFFISLYGYFLCVGILPFGPLLGIAPGTDKNADPKLPPLILVHGLYNNAAVWLYLARRLRKKGYNVSTFSYSSFRVPFDTIQNRLDAHISRVEQLHPGLKPVIIGHSLGGIIARAWLLDVKKRARLGGLVTIGAPHGGSKLAALAKGALAKNLMPDSELIAALREVPELPFPCLAIVSPIDEYVLPATHLLPPLPPQGNWQLRFTASVGHLRSLFHPRTATIVLETLESMRAGRDDAQGNTE